MRRGIDSIGDFIFMDDKLERVKLILVPGSSQKELMYKASELYHKGYGNYIIVSGSNNSKLKNNMTEADFLGDIAIELGVPRDRVIRERRATNTFENAKFSLELIKDNNFEIDRFILVAKGYHSRRAYLTYKTIFPKEAKFIVSPVTDERRIEKDNWYLDEKKTSYVMGEVKKIGSYFTNCIKSLSGEEEYKF